MALMRILLSEGFCEFEVWLCIGWDYKLHPCNLPFGSREARSILLRAKLAPRCARDDVEGIATLSSQ